MRLTCPNCSAQYEVPDEVIPEEGRDVQCSNCEKTWFQVKHADQPVEKEPAPVAEEPAAPEPSLEPEPEPVKEEPTPEMTAEPAPEPEPQPTSRSIDPAVANILKEEAAREADLRAKEGGSLEIQPDLALDAPLAPEPEPERSVEYVPPSQRPAKIRQRGALPDVEAINSSLRSDKAATKPKVEERAPRKSGGGFMRGFALILIVGVILLLVYGNAQRISDAVPQAEPILSTYVSLVDQARIWLETQTSGAAQN
ncbi:zinc-ribbon domain-containing protein [Ruegeria atlantica]|uniref:zinc-ribbon domain-containing protein n=1 Tax=Ruegeria atlantica TaxID=81569 RepID=UPI0014803395|nr:zinc-ribbon domain-containing protein [Ruegeria atlantica]